MKLLPIREVTIETKLSVDEVKKRLSQYVQKPVKWYKYRWPFKGSLPYEGEIIGNGFRFISRGERTKIYGEIYDNGQIRIIKIKFRLIPHQQVIHLGLIYGLLGLGLLFTVVLPIIESTFRFKNLIVLLILGFISAVLYGFHIISFKHEISPEVYFFNEFLKE